MFINSDEHDLATTNRHSNRLIEGLLSACAFNDYVRAHAGSGIHDRFERIGCS